MTNPTNTTPATTTAAAFGFAELPLGYYSAAELAAHWHADKHSCFLMDQVPGGTPEQLALAPGYHPSWATFVPMAQVAALDYAMGEHGGWLQCALLVQHYELGTYSVTWSSHLEGRAPCFVQVLQLGERNAQAVSFTGPAEGGVLTGLLEQLVNGGLWYSADPQYSGLPVE
jgi:hypothetical protein